jgi:hypothetical protein
MLGQGDERERCWAISASERMMADIELLRLLRATMRVVDRHAERKEGSRLLHVPMLPLEMKELRAALEPFRERYNAMMDLNRCRVDEVVNGSPATTDELQVRAYIQGIGIVTEHVDPDPLPH